MLSLKKSTWVFALFIGTVAFSSPACAQLNPIDLIKIPLNAVFGSDNKQQQIPNVSGANNNFSSNSINLCVVTPCSGSSIPTNLSNGSRPITTTNGTVVQQTQQPTGTAVQTSQTTTNNGAIQTNTATTQQKTSSSPGVTLTIPPIKLF